MTAPAPIVISAAALVITYLDLLRDKEVLLQGIQETGHKRVKRVMLSALHKLDLKLVEVSDALNRSEP